MGSDSSAVRIGDVIEDARKKFRLLAALATVQSLAIGFLIYQGVGLAVGAGIALPIFLLVEDWGKKLNQRPRGLNLVKARTGAGALSFLVPIAFFVSIKLYRDLHHPVLVSYAVANHPEVGRSSDEALIKTIRARSAFYLLRASGFGLVILAAVCGLVALDSPEWGSAAAITAIVSLAMAFTQIGIGFYGIAQLRQTSADNFAKVKRAAIALWWAFPFGTWAAVTAMALIPPAPKEESDDSDDGGDAG